MADLMQPAPTNRAASVAPDTNDQLARQQAIKQIERERRFKISTAVAAVLMLFLVFIWATSDNANAGGWPTHGFSQSSSIPHVWNDWIIYPLGAWVVLTAASYWNTYWRKPISEGEIQREIERQQSTR
jgi:hypothetical protein